MTAPGCADWPAAFAAMPRSRFLPDVIWPLDDDGAYPVVDRRRDPEAWERWAASDVAIVTQWDDGAHTGTGPGTVATSSASQPALVAGMLDDLDVAAGHRVLDVGVGTGWTTGLLSARLGDDHVVGIEVDADVARLATGRLRASGVNPTIVRGDGAAGWVAGAPYDRVQVTYAVQEIAPAWIDQTRPGGLIVAPWRTRFSNVGAVVRLTVDGDGDGGAEGRFTQLAEFMVDRHQRTHWPDRSDYMPGPDWPADTRETTATIGPDKLWNDPAPLIVGMAVPDVVHNHRGGDDVTWLYSLTCRSWAMVDADGEVYQGGPCDLWSEAEAVYAWWDRRGRPDIDRFGLTVTADDQRVWLDRPDNHVPR